MTVHNHLGASMSGKPSTYPDEMAPRGRIGRVDNPTNAGMIGFILAMSAVGLLAVVFVLNIFLNQEEHVQQNIERVRLMYFWFLFLDAVCFLCGLTATIFCGRALAPTNSLYPGWSVIGLVLGILEMI